ESAHNLYCPPHRPLLTTVFSTRPKRPVAFLAFLPRALFAFVFFFRFVFFFAFVFFGLAGCFVGAAKLPPGDCATLPGTSSGVGLVNGPWHASPSHGRRSACCCGKPPPRRAS